MPRDLLPRARSNEVWTSLLNYTSCQPLTDQFLSHGPLSLFLSLFLSLSLKLSNFTAEQHPPLLACAYLDYYIRTLRYVESTWVERVI